jgi:profilin
LKFKTKFISRVYDTTIKMQSRIASLKMPSSWNEYITTVMADSGFVSKGAIYGTEGRKWAASKGFDVTSDEVKNLVSGFTDPTKLWVQGVKVGGKIYTCTRSESGLIVGRESAECTGCVIYRCNKCVVIAVHEEGAHPGGCFNLITKLGEYLKEQGV